MKESKSWIHEALGNVFRMHCMGAIVKFKIMSEKLAVMNKGVNAGLE